MSFSSQVKRELTVSHGENPRHCNIAEILAFINNSARIVQKYGRLRIILDTDNRYAAGRFYQLVRTAFKFSCQVSVRKNRKNGKINFLLLVDNGAVCMKMIKAANLMTKEPQSIDKMHVSPMVIKNECCKRAYLKSSFLTNGSLSDPKKNYHLEFVLPTRERAECITELVNTYGLNAKIIMRKGHYVVYLKEGEHIVDLLNIIGAHNALLNFENIRILKDISNNVNRKVNCETANLTKTVNAAVKQVEDIQYIYDNKGGSYLEEPLREVADLRLMNPNATLKEIGGMLLPAISKSGVNHRLRRISDIAEKLRRDKYD